MTQMKDLSSTLTSSKLTLAEVFETLLAGPAPIRFTAYDGSSAGVPSRRKSSTIAPEPRRLRTTPRPVRWRSASRTVLRPQSSWLPRSASEGSRSPAGYAPETIRLRISSETRLTSPLTTITCPMD